MRHNGGVAGLAALFALAGLPACVAPQDKPKPGAIRSRGVAGAHEPLIAVSPTLQDPHPLVASAFRRLSQARADRYGHAKRREGASCLAVRLRHTDEQLSAGQRPGRNYHQA